MEPQQPQQIAVMMFSRKPEFKGGVSNKDGFTLVERLIVIAIIGMLAAIVVTNASKSRQGARDGQRVSDLASVQNALNLYFTDKKVYPATLSLLVPTYINFIPTDPLTNAQYKYAALDVNSTLSSCETYHLGATLERSNTASLGQDADKNVLGTACTGSVVDFYGISLSCGASTAVPDQCFDLFSQ